MLPFTFALKIGQDDKKRFGFSDVPPEIERMEGKAYIATYSGKTGKEYKRLLVKSGDCYLDYRISKTRKFKSLDDWKRAVGFDGERLVFKGIEEYPVGSVPKKTGIAPEKNQAVESGGNDLKKTTPVKNKSPRHFEGIDTTYIAAKDKTNTPGTIANKDSLGQGKNAGDIESVIDWLEKKLAKLNPENPYASLQILKENPTFENVEKYSEQLERFKGRLDKKFYKESRDYLFQYLASKRAVYDAGMQEKDSNYTRKTYGAYDLGDNDCYTWFKKVLKKTTNEDLNLKRRPGNFLEERIGEHERNRQDGIALKNLDRLYLQVGDVVRVDRSPNGPGSDGVWNNHWGMIVYDNGELKVAHRSNGIQLSTLDDFFRHTRGEISIVRYGTPEYAQHFEVDVNRSKGNRYEFSARLEQGKVPGEFYTISGQQYAKANGNENRDKGV
ncbi:MAG: hypothetical protein WC506_02610 [Candidatus Micrarchaeia archaeon]